IFSLLCKRVGLELNQNSIAKELKVSSTAVSKALKTIEKENIIIIKKQGIMNLILISLNRDNRRIMQLKRVENIRQIYESGLVDELEERLAGATIVLFGSYSRGDDNFKSDIDIAVIGRKNKEIDLSRFEKMLERKIIINFYPTLKEIHKELKENICNGIVLVGGLEL
ncbi:MAG: nucleotidyltransferase domain-containing protein, partial [archaeon]